MLPSTFKEESKEQDRRMLRLKAKLEMAKFLQDTLEETALMNKDKQNVDPLNQKFRYFCLFNVFLVFLYMHQLNV